MEYEVLPESHKLANEQAGTVEEFFYDTLAYTDDGVARESLRKRALVYLPYGYDASKSYNILYLLYGGGEDESSLFNIGEHEGPKGVNTIHLLDHAIANGPCDPVIVVTPTFNGNGTASSWAEKKNELIPGIESKYATYANGDVSTESLKVSHAYQAFAGFSMGSMTSSQSAMAHCIDIFGYIGSYSAGLQHTNLTEEALLDMVRNAGNSLYYWYNGNGFATWLTTIICKLVSK